MKAKSVRWSLVLMAWLFVGGGACSDDAGGGTETSTEETEVREMLETIGNDLYQLLDDALQDEQNKGSGVPSQCPGGGTLAVTTAAAGWTVVFTDCNQQGYILNGTLMVTRIDVLGIPVYCMSGTIQISGTISQTIEIQQGKLAVNAGSLCYSIDATVNGQQINPRSADQSCTGGSGGNGGSGGGTGNCPACVGVNTAPLNGPADPTTTCRVQQEYDNYTECSCTTSAGDTETLYAYGGSCQF